MPLPRMHGACGAAVHLAREPKNRLFFCATYILNIHGAVNVLTAIYTIFKYAVATRRASGFLPGCPWPIPVVSSMSAIFRQTQSCVWAKCRFMPNSQENHNFIRYTLFQKITSKRCWAAKRSGYVKSGRSRWPHACSSMTSYGDALAVALTETCVHFLNKVCASQNWFTRSWLFPVGIFSQIGRFSKISKISKTAFLAWVASTLTRAQQFCRAKKLPVRPYLGRIDDLFSSKNWKMQKKIVDPTMDPTGIVCNHFAPSRSTCQCKRNT
jgi:hypothetical protein